MPEPDAQNWSFYLCNVNDRLASIAVDLALRSQVPVVSKPWLLWIWVYFNSPRPDGLSDSSEAPTLFEIEDALRPRLSNTCNALFCGRITTQGLHRGGASSTSTPKPVMASKNAVAKAMAVFDGYRFDRGDQHDSDWNQYLSVLYPSPEQMQCISNRDLLDHLLERGDVLAIPRMVHHWLYFPSESSRASYRQAAVTKGFAVESESTGDAPLPFCLVIARKQSIQQEAIDETVIDLFRMAQTLGADYDGWETPIVTQ